MTGLSSLSSAVPLRRACESVGFSRATFYRRRAPATKLRAKRGPRKSPRALKPDERDKVIAVLHAPEFADQPPREIYAALLSLGIFLCSPRTMYRILAGLRQSTERRRGHVRTAHAMPKLEAYAPNQVWTWDITKVAGESPGQFYFVFVIIDLFSRMVVGWMVAETENAKLAGHLISSTMKLHDIPAGTLTIHSDRGAPMTANSMTQLLQTLGVEQSLSRPRVSNDNPFVESLFKTAKYQPEYPSRFASVCHVRAWFQQCFDWYCHHHHHQGLALFTPADVFHGRVAEIAATRQAALDAAYALHPERFVRGRPSVRLPPTRVHINLRLDDPITQPERAEHEVLARELRTATVTQ